MINADSLQAETLVCAFIHLKPSHFTNLLKMVTQILTQLLGLLK